MVIKERIVMSLQEKVLSIQSILQVISKVISFAEKLVDFVLQQTEKKGV